MANIVAIVGRPNVGKSTLFNRLTETRKAIMDNQAGVTRDRHYGFVQWLDKNFTIIDTGGYVTHSEDIFEEAIRRQVQIAIEEASVILFMVDAREGLHPLDKEFAQILRRSQKPVYVVANKSETPESVQQSVEFFGLGISEEIHTVSAETGSGTGDLLDKVVSHFEENDLEDPLEGLPRIAILGRPNVGKSSFLNVLLGDERSIVTDIPGTTRDAIDTRYKLYGKDFILTDTAGVRKKSKVKEDIEFYSVMRSLRALEECDVCIIMIDATQGVESQDLNLLHLAAKARKGILLMINKWDLIEKDTKTAQLYTKAIHEKITPLTYVPVIFTSVTEKQRIFQAIEKALQVYENRKKRIATSELNEVMLQAIEEYPPPSLKGKFIKIKYITQLPNTKAPAFAFFCNLPQYIKEPYQRYLENKMRDHFDFEGVPLQLFFRKK